MGVASYIRVEEKLRTQIELSKFQYGERSVRRKCIVNECCHACLYIWLHSGKLHGNKAIVFMRISHDCLSCHRHCGRLLT